MTDLLHTHLTYGLRPVGECPACDQARADLEASQEQALVSL